MLQAITLFDQKATEIKRLVADVKSFIADNKIKEALQKLMDYDKSVTEENQLVSLQSRWTKNETDFTISRVISQENYGLERRMIIDALLQVADMFTINIEPPERSENYNLTIGDEAGLEKIIGPKSKLFEMSWLKRAFSLSKSIGRITVTKRQNGREWSEFATGFLVEGGYLFTNYHVLANPEEAERAKVEFNYMKGEEVSAYSFDSSSWVGTNENKLDFARVKVNDGGSVPLSTWGFLEIDDSGNVQENDSLPIIQHPEGGEMKIALEANSILRKDGPHIYYQTDTLAGSSGSPVFNRDWKVVALHHAGMNPERANRGILFSEIMRYLASLLPKKENASGQNIHINIGGDLEYSVTILSNEGGPGNALYTIHLTLDQVPTDKWTQLFVRNWDRPPQIIASHRPGIASVVANKIILSGTTLEEVKRYHEATLKLVVTETNKQASQMLD